MLISALRYQAAKGIEKTPQMSKHLETEMREDVDVSVKGGRSQPGKASVAVGSEEPYWEDARCQANAKTETKKQHDVVGEQSRKKDEMYAKRQRGSNIEWWGLTFQRR